MSSVSTKKKVYYPAKPKPFIQWSFRIVALAIVVYWVWAWGEEITAFGLWFNAFFFVIFIVREYLTLKASRPLFIISQDFILTRNAKVLFSQIAEWRPPRGGSEPSVITKDKRQIDLPTSLLEKDKRRELEALISERIAQITS